jgi:hypothetical protein
MRTITSTLHPSSTSLTARFWAWFSAPPARSESRGFDIVTQRLARAISAGRSIAVILRIRRASQSSRPTRQRAKAIAVARCGEVLLDPAAAGRPISASRAVGVVQSSERCRQSVDFARSEQDAGLVFAHQFGNPGDPRANDSRPAA